MRQTTFSSPTTGSVDYPNAVAFMYSRQPVIVRCSLPDDTPVTATVTCESNGGTTYTETRKLKGGRAEFDISRIMQVLAEDTDVILGRLLNASPSLAELFSLEVQVGGVTVLTALGGIQAMHGALDAGETYGGPTSRRLFLNYPQTICMWQEPHGRFEFELDGNWCQPEFVEGGTRCREVNIVAALPDSVVAALPKGRAVSGTTTWYNGIEEGQAAMQPTRDVTFYPDSTPRGRGAYLRWLNRRGEVSYWLFEKAELETISAVNETFERYYEGDPGEPVGQTFMNPEKRNYAEAQRQTIAASRLTSEEFDDLCSLLVSPVVELLDDTKDRWHRVNVEPGSITKKNKRLTPKVYNFDAVITLATRNVVRL